MMRIKVVGPCASGKSVLTAGLRRLGFDAHSAAQDHSYVPDMWQRINPADLLIYLDVSLDNARRRHSIIKGDRVGLPGEGDGLRTWDQEYLDEQHRRLRHARAHCDLYLSTNELTEEEVLSRVVTFLQELA